MVKSMAGRRWLLSLDVGVYFDFLHLEREGHWGIHYEGSKLGNKKTLV